MIEETGNSILNDSAAQTENDARLKLLYEIGRILASEETMNEAAPQILEAICQNLQLELGELWCLSNDESVLRLKNVWHLPLPSLEKFAAESHGFEFPAGMSLPGKVWAKNVPLWVENLADEDNLPRKELMKESGLQSGFAFPILLGEKFLGAFSFFSRTARPPDESLLQTFAAVGSHIGQFFKREKIESNLRESEETYRIVAETASDAIIKIDTDSRVLFVNHSVERIFGYRVEEMVGQPLTMIMPEQLREKHRAGFNRYLETGSRNLLWTGIEIPARHADGHTFPLEISFGEYKESGKRFFIGIARDISERKLAEQSLKDSGERYRALVEATSTVVWRATPEGELSFVGSHWEKVSGQKIEEILGSGWLSALHPDDREKTIEIWKNSLANKKIYETEFRVFTTNREYRWFAVRGVPILNEDGSVREWIGANTDITERKRAETERERLLESEQQAREIAERANHAKDEFIALVSHELRSPLNAMLGWTRILQEQKPDGKTTDYALDVIVRNARAQSKLIEDLLDIARVGEKKLRLEMKPIELAPIINAAVEIIKPAAEAKSLHISETLDRAANFVMGDEDRLRQVLENLLSNAVKFTSADGRIDVRLERENDRARIILSDTGQGFSDEFLPQMFERFKQADPSTTRRHGGLGIGLSLARDLVELHSGTISAQSAGEGKGATFIVSLPLRAIKPIREISSREEIMDSQGKLNGFWILAVDDEADAREIVSFMLQINGAKVTTANSAVEALDILKNAGERLPDILLSDISMPNESGYALLEKIRALPQENGGQIPAVALTAFNRPEDRQNAFEAGFQKHLGKPVEMDDLISAIIETAGAK